MVQVKAEELNIFFQRKFELIFLLGKWIIKQFIKKRPPSMIKLRCNKKV